MTVMAETWESYAQLFLRLNPMLEQVVFAGADARAHWASAPSAATHLYPTTSMLLAPRAPRVDDIDGGIDPSATGDLRYGFRIRGGLGEVLGLVGLTQRIEAGGIPELSALYALIKPALDCLQSELTARTAIGQLHESLADTGRDLDLLQRLAEAAPAEGFDALDQIPELALDHLSGMFAAMLLPGQNMTLSRTQAGYSRAAESSALAQMHRHLMTRAQLHDCTLVANKLVLDGSGVALPYKAISTPIRDETRRVVGVLAVFRVDTDADFQLRDAQALELLSRKATQILRASFDALTGVLTQSAFVAQATLKLSEQDDLSSKHCLLYVDIDQLNVINENLGLPVGDEIIQGVATLLSQRLRAGSLVARLGGDRFVMLIPGCRVEPAARIAEDLRAAASRLSGARADKPILVSLSIGVACIGERERRLDHALAAAELACRTAKERGRNRIEIYHGDLRDTISHPALAGYVAQVSAALAAGTFELLAQSILPLAGVPGDPRFEILVRLRAADGSRLGIDKLTSLPGCQELIRSIDRCVIDHAIDRLASCGESLRRHPAKFSLNIAAASIGSEEFWRFLEERVRRTRIEPGTLSFEFPEEAANEHVALIAPCMRRLRELGVSFALDNFGRGAGSLSNLNSLPVSWIKIDGSFSRDLLSNPKSQSMILAITRLAKTFNLETVAAHVETDAIRARAAQLGVDYGQGFFIGKPSTLDDAIRDLPLYACFSTSATLVDQVLGVAS